MKLSLAEKTVITTIIFLVLVLLAMLSVQFFIKVTGIDVRQIVYPSPAATYLQPESQDDSVSFDTIDVTESTGDEEVGADIPNRQWLGWVIIIISSLLVVSGLAFKFLRSS
jgi:hypothetical protein